MKTEASCPECGTPLPSGGAAGGMCPRCLLEGGTDEEPRRIGNYRLLGQIGEGGMGVVYEAEQSRPVQRRVALKLVKRGMDTKEVIARFEAERQALALMEHPNIARVFDAGATERGRPYFVMEFVPGVPITDYCDRERLGTDERLALFGLVCDAVQHAHQKGIIHRDIKPSNVLVTILDGEPVPKVIDFGVAKATAHRLTEQTVYTELGRQIGTPEYMSPEQAESSELDVDTRTDVYSLGVLLYELLVGTLPFESRKLREAGWEGMCRMIRETEPPRPSARATTLDSDAARNRRTDPGSLARRLRGDLDWIVMKALEKERTRRYATASELAADVARYVRREPVSAGPPSFTYRMSKFVQRHRLGVAAGTIVFLALVVGAVSATVGLVRARQAEARAVAAEARALEEAAAKGQVSEFLKDLFRVSDPGEARGNTITAREMLDKGSERIDEMLVDQPETRAELMATMGEVYRNLGLYSQAEPLLDDALETLVEVRGADDPGTLAARAEVAELYRIQGRSAEAEELYLDVVAARKRVLGAEHADTLHAVGELARHYRNLGRTDEAEPLLVETLEAQRRLLGEDDPATLRTMNSLAVVYTDQKKWDEAEPLYLQVVETQKRVQGVDHPQTLAAMNNLARLYFRTSRLDMAEPLFVDTLAARRRIMGDDHPVTLRAMSNLAYLYQNLSRWDEAERLYLDALEAHRRVLGRRHPDTATILYNLACFEAIRGNGEKSLEWLGESVDAGWHRTDLMEADADLETIREDPRFDALFARAGRNPKS